MPHAIASGEGVAPVAEYRRALRDLLDEAQRLKPNGGIEPALKIVDFNGRIEEFGTAQSDATSFTKEQRPVAVETALRQIFYEILATTPIEDSAFTAMWSLLDITTMLSDNECCEFNLPFWLVEELLESQTLDGCRMIFDYLESRREAMVAKNYNKKYLTILRACNDLLKRLSRAEDTVFCGRVFIYLFSSLLFGDRSSVNLRGEFHVANTTTFDKTATKPSDSSMQMEVDPQPQNETSGTSEPTTKITVTEANQTSGSNIETTDPIATQTESAQPTLDYDDLYPIFWSLQDYFSRPSSLFESEYLASFKSGLEATLRKFKEVQKDSDAGSTSGHTDETKQSNKRKWQGEEESNKATFNPKYLTSRDLFELEISDIAFRRHILVQSLILIDFLLSQTPSAKAKLETLKNRSVIYSFTLDEEEAKWAESMRVEIATYLQQGAEGKFYYRMVDTVLSRDKNWVYWKAESCPVFSRPQVLPSEYIEARNGARRAAAKKRPRNNPLGALDLGFLSETGSTDGLEKFKDQERYRVPAVDAYRKSIENDTLDLGMASNDTEKERIIEGRASKTWRTLRIASRSRFSMFDKIDDGNKLDVLFADPEHDADKREKDTDNEDPDEQKGDGSNHQEEEPDDVGTGSNAATDAENVKPEEKAVEDAAGVLGTPDMAMEATQTTMQEAGDAG